MQISHIFFLIQNEALFEYKYRPRWKGQSETGNFLPK